MVGRDPPGLRLLTYMPCHPWADDFTAVLPESRCVTPYALSIHQPAAAGRRHRLSCNHRRNFSLSVVTFYVKGLAND
jgi:hypothetical protein